MSKSLTVYMRDVAALIGSLQITVPAGCMNDCAFCVYKQHATKFKTNWRSDHERWHREVRRRLMYAADRVEAIMITSHGEPTLNMAYIEDIMNLLNRTTPWLSHVEIQTSGVGLTEEKLDCFYELGVRVISLSIPALDTNEILKIMRVPPRYDYDPIALSERIQSKGFTLRLSVAMTNWFDKFKLDEILNQLKSIWKPDQVSFKKIIGADELSSKRYDDFAQEFASRAYTRLELLPMGVWKYDSHGMGIVWNDDCMISRKQESPRYLILQPDARLYTRWDTKASVIF
ncbi:MAG: radical SAM protein [Candidatus Hermodarchaeota archaeon]